MRRVSTLALVVAASAASGCINIPDTPAPQCYSNSDCDQSTGEVCADGVCYGDPPTGTFGVSISPPSGTDLVSVERASEDLPAVGFLTDLTLETPVTLSGTVTAASCAATSVIAPCPTGPLDASIAVSRPPRFPGGDGFAQTTHETGDATDATFTLPVPRTRPAVDVPYTITVSPADRDASAPGSGTAPAELVPPLRTTVSASGDMTLALALGSDDLPVITGDLTDSDGSPLADYRVSALGRWTGDDSDSLVSSVAYSSDGHYVIVLSAGLAGPVTIVAKPIDTTVVAPTLELAGVSDTTSSTQNIAQPAGIGATHLVTLTIQGTASSGAVGAVSGARVIATARETSTPAPGLTLSTIVSAEATTGDDGTAPLSLLDGSELAGGYDLRVVPPADSTFAVLDEPAFQPADGAHLLVPRVAVQGSVVDATGAPVANVSVTARPSLQFAWSLDDDAQLFLAQIPAATAVTGADGDFVVFVDPAIDNVAGTYDISFEPPTGSSVPSFTEAGVAIPAGTVGPMVIAQGTVTLPEAANLHGLISDPNGTSVAGGELRVFRISTDHSLCNMALPNKPVPCAVPALLQAHATSDSDGVVRFTLPRTP